MNHNEHDEQILSAYLDGELSAAEAARVEKQLAERPALAATFSQLQRIRALLEGLPRAQAPDTLVDGVLAAAERPKLVSEPHAPQSPAAHRWVRHLATAAVVLVFLAASAVVVAVLWNAAGSEATRSAGRIGDAAGPSDATRLALDVSDPGRAERRLAEVLRQFGLNSYDGPASAAEAPSEYFAVHRKGENLRELEIVARPATLREIQATIETWQATGRPPLDVVSGLAGDARLSNEPGRSTAPLGRSLRITIQRPAE